MQRLCKRIYSVTKVDFGQDLVKCIGAIKIAYNLQNGIVPVKDFKGVQLMKSVSEKIHKICFIRSIFDRY